MGSKLIMGKPNIVEITDADGTYRLEHWDYSDYQKMTDTLDEQMAEGEILDWYIEN